MATLTLASSFELRSLMGKSVKSLRDFAGIPTSTVGTVVEVYGKKHHEGIMVLWNNTRIKDGFARDEEFDETQFLEVIE